MGAPFRGNVCTEFHKRLTVFVGSPSQDLGNMYETARIDMPHVFFDPFALFEGGIVFCFFLVVT